MKSGVGTKGSQPMPPPPLWIPAPYRSTGPALRRYDGCAEAAFCEDDGWENRNDGTTLPPGGLGHLLTGFLRQLCQVAVVFEALFEVHHASGAGRFYHGRTVRPLHPPS